MTALLLSAALVLGQQPPPGGQPPPPPPAPANAPKGLPPGLTFVVADKDGKLAFVFQYPETKTEVRDVKVKGANGQETVQKQQVPVTELKSGLAPLDEKFTKITTIDGKPVTYADAVKRVGAGAVAAMAYTFADKKIDPAYLKALRDDVLVFELTPPMGPEAAPPPPPEKK